MLCYMRVLIRTCTWRNYYNLQVLDADNARLINSTGRVAARDMVQFVPMREVQSKY
jgi:hypothetical protein